MEKEDGNQASNTVEARQNPFQLIAALGFDRQAEGELYIDDGVSTNTTDKEIVVSFYVNDTMVTGRTSNNLTGVDLGSVSTRLNKVKIYGIIEKIDPELFYLYTDTDCSNKFMDNGPEGWIMNNTHYLQDQYAGVLNLLHLPFDIKLHHEFCVKWGYKQWDRLAD